MWLGADGLGLGIGSERRMAVLFVGGDCWKTWGATQKYGCEILFRGIGLGSTVADGDGNRGGRSGEVAEPKRNGACAGSSMDARMHWPVDRGETNIYPEGAWTRYPSSQNARPGWKSTRNVTAKIPPLHWMKFWRSSWNGNVKTTRNRWQRFVGATRT
jgi:hypothetical protein